MNRLRGSVPGRKRPSLRWWAVAAVAALLVSAGLPDARGVTIDADNEPAARPVEPIPLLLSANPPRTGESRTSFARAPRPEILQLPLAFEPAAGRGPVDADYAARGPGYSVFINGGGALLALRAQENPPDSSASPKGSGKWSRRVGRTPGASHRLVHVRFEGADADARSIQEQPLPGRIHRLVGANPARWSTDGIASGRVRYRSIRPGIDVAFYGNGRELEYDFVVAPGAAGELPRLRFDGVGSARVDALGNLVLETGAGSLVQRRPVAYQDGPRGRDFVEAAYRVDGDGGVGIDLGDHDPCRALVVDPVLSYATFLGGFGADQCWDVAVDASGAAFIVGETDSSVFPYTRILSPNALQTNYQGGVVTVAGDAFVAKLNPSGTAFQWFTYVGGEDLDAAFTIALTAGGEPVIGGFTTSSNFPLSADAFQSTLQGETNKYTLRKPLEGFVARLSADGSRIVASTFYGGEGEDQILDLAVLPDGTLVTAGSTTSLTLPQAGGPQSQSTNAGGTDGFVAVFSADAKSLLRSTYLGGSGRDSIEGVAIGEAGAVVHLVGITSSTNLAVASALQSTNAGGSDVLAAGLRLGDLAPVYLTYLGGKFDDDGYRVSVGPGGGVWLAGGTSSFDFPIAHALQTNNAGGTDAFLARLSPATGALEYSTYFGGFGNDAFWDVNADTFGFVHVTGQSASSSLPGLSTNTALMAVNQGLLDFVVARFAPGGEVYSTFYGSYADEWGLGIATDAAGNAYIAGFTSSVVLPVSSTNVAQAYFGGFTSDGFAMKITYEPALTAALAGEGIDVSWPAPNAGFALESSPRLGSNSVWTMEQAPMRTAAGRHTVRLPMSATNCVFRLRWAP